MAPITDVVEEVSAPDARVAEAPDAETPPVSRPGSRIRALRRARGLTLVQLAERADLSHPFLSQVERGLARPSMSSLERIALALGSSAVELLVDDPEEAGAGTHAPASSIVRARAGVSGRFGEGTARMLVEGPHRFQVLELEGDTTTDGRFHAHAEDEFITVLSGSVRYEIDGEPPTILAVGDSAYTRSGARHRWRSEDGAPYRLLLVKENPGRVLHGGTTS
ncbi:helix-turn-helix domain-containing protein [Rathayibacter sp. Leaf296]|uniref:helix-turn-helix domain-containing protein n=1 Tax=Rathayibacter sp. Leaf296 TaxID=1736327 RepID=UPI0009E80790|nr:cupin domain-containing protein [Rathayibacter sp. Leaf296]